MNLAEHFNRKTGRYVVSNNGRAEMPDRPAVAHAILEMEAFRKASYGLVERLAQTAHRKDVDTALGFSATLGNLWLCLGDIAPQRRAKVLEDLRLIEALVNGEEASRG